MIFQWRPLEPADLAHVSTIAAGVHPGFPEDDAVFEERLHLCPDGCWLLAADGYVAGYVFSHPVLLGSVPPLNSLLGRLAPDADSFYIHDLALLPVARGSGAAPRIIEKLVNHATVNQFATMSLVAVNSSQRFWEKRGFVLSDRPDLAAKLRTYEDAARFMIRKLD